MSVIGCGCLEERVSSWEGSARATLEAGEGLGWGWGWGPSQQRVWRCLSASTTATSGGWSALFTLLFFICKTSIEKHLYRVDRRIKSNNIWKQQIAAVERRGGRGPTPPP